MKIIKQGNVTLWWVGKQGRCWQCKTVIEFEECDPVKEHTSTDYRDNDSARLPCPTCGESISVIQ